MSARPLEGIVVVAMEQALAVPFATRQLADLGARVIKVERPITGDFARQYDDVVQGLSSAFVWLNRGKESLELDVKSPQGRETLHRLLERADVFVHNIAPEAAGRLGLDSKTLSKSYPRLICGSVSGYGATGAMAGSKAYDLLVQGETGIMSLSGTGADLAKVGISIADVAAGMYMYASVLAAVYNRDRTGEILPVDVSLFDSLTEWLGYPLLYTIGSGEAPKRMGTSHATIAPYGAFATADGHQLLLAVQNEREWVRFCEHVLHDPALATDPRFASPTVRVLNRVVLDEVVTHCLSQLDRETILDRLDQASIASARLNSIEDLANHEQLTGRDRWITVGSEAGPVRTLLPPWAPAGDDRSYGDIPALGEHTADILDWLGIDATSTAGSRPAG